MMRLLLFGVEVSTASTLIMENRKQLAAWNPEV
jgi:hypothetical protein